MPIITKGRMLLHIGAMVSAPFFFAFMNIVVALLPRSWNFVFSNFKITEENKCFIT